jgi:hypothetical protein
MSLLWMDDFKTYWSGSTFIADGTPWDIGPNTSVVDDPDPNAASDSRCLEIDNGSASGTNLFASAPDPVMGIAARIWIPGLTASPCLIAGFLDSAGNVDYSLRVLFNGALAWYKGSSQVVSSEVPVLTSNAWTHIEAKVNFTTGELSVRIEGTPLTALDYTDPAPVGGDCYGGNFSELVNMDFLIKDVALWNGAGSVNNDFIGPCAVYRLPVDADVSSGWSRSSGTTDYELLDETPPDDASYIFAGEGPIPAPSIMEFADLSPDVVAVRGIMTMVRARKTDGGDGKLQVSLTPNAGTDWDDGADRAITTAFTYWSDISELSPDTGTQWTPVEVNAAQVKLNRTL